VAAVKVIFDFSAQQIAIEGDGPELLDLLGKVREIAPKLTHIQISPGPGAVQLRSPNGDGGENRRAPNNNPPDVGTLKQFVRQLDFQNQSERIAAIAYYYKVHESRDTFSPKEMEQWFTFAGFQKPAQMGVALSDASRKLGYLESGGYAKWKVTIQGENLITRKLNNVVQE
jgi:hypothetical protein